MKTKKENLGNNVFETLDVKEMLQIKGGTEDEYQGGTDTQKDGVFE